jgi:hypothetical protein
MADWTLKLRRLLFDRSLRPQKRSTALVSMANSLATIAYALKIIVQKEYGVDLDAPKLSRADFEREIFEPMYVNDEEEAVREEVERIQALEAENGRSDGSGGLKSHPNASDTQISRFGMKFAPTNTRGGDSDELTEQERDFLAEIDRGPYGSGENT